MHLWSKRKVMQLEKLVKHKIEPSRKNHIPLHLLLSQSKLSDQLNIWDWRETTILVNADLDFYIFNIFIHVRWLTGHITNNFSHNIILHLKCLLVKVVAIYDCRHGSFRSCHNNLQPPGGDPEKILCNIFDKDNFPLPC